ncbi:N-acetylmuramic acid 6-phosphate etherase [Streptacidiphilus monticola]|uniref:N-acetylmuramic acid 6-phosphate etherase n=1 Tax=Streptacidiphilus monticola TaxID=2161674 RepID=A0ABW1GA35_9ACTN
MTPDPPLETLRTEQPHPDSVDLGSMTADQALQLMERHEHAVLDALVAAHDALAAAAERVAAVYLAGGRTVLLGSGTSGRLALQEVSELPATFGVPAEQFPALLATRAPIGPAAVAASEDDTEGVARALRERGIGPGDAVIGLAASGRTPFVLAAIRQARAAGAWTCGIANNPGTPLLCEAELGVLLDTGPELLTGSTRMKAGTAQKIALNRITTAAMALAGRIHGNYMVEMRAGNGKLRERAVRIVADLAQCDPATARGLLAAHDWHIGDALRAATPRR